MKQTMLVLAVCAAGAILTGAKAPSVEEMKARVHKDHPRLFLTPATLKTFADRANGPGKAELDYVLARVKSYPEDPKLEVNARNANLEDGKLVFHRHQGNQDTASYGVKSTGGVEAMNCAIAYFATGKEAYRQQALKFI